MSKSSLFNAILTLIFFVFFGFELSAQETKAAPTVHRPMTKTELSADLKYSETQKNTLGEHYTTYLTQMKAVRDNKDLSNEDKAAAYLKVKEEYKKGIVSTLTPEQYESYMAVEKLKQAARKERADMLKNN